MSHVLLRLLQLTLVSNALNCLRISSNSSDVMRIMLRFCTIMFAKSRSYKEKSTVDVVVYAPIIQSSHNKLTLSCSNIRAMVQNTCSGPRCTQSSRMMESPRVSSRLPSIAKSDNKSLVSLSISLSPPCSATLAINSRVNNTT